MEINERKRLILNTIINEHINTGLPVGSTVLVNKYKLNISPATVRNEMSVLEENGYIVQPHTSAGRIPTEKAYVLYLENIKVKEINDEKASEFRINLDEGDLSFKELAKNISSTTKQAVFWAFHKHNLFYTGISNLFSQPEFSQLNIIQDISTIIDRMDEIIDEIFEDLDNGESILIGAENPFGNFCSTILYKYKYKENTGLFGILGPMRMDYQKNLAIGRYINKVIIKSN